MTSLSLTWLIYNIMVVSDVQPNDSLYTHTHIYTYTYLFLFRFFSLMMVI